MSNKIESRIVTMTFDNAQFEKNVATTQKSLKDLDENLKFKDADKSFSNITKAASKVSFSQLESNIGTVGTVIEKSMSLGVKAMDRLKDKILDVGENLLKGITQPVSDAFNQIVTGGMNRATKVDKAKFKMAGLGVEWEDIYEDINYGVADTAFGLDQAASAAANLVSAGIDFGETYGATGSSPMAKALRGISGLSAMFDRSYDDIAGLYQVIGAAGRVTNDALSRFQERGIPVTAKLAEAFGTSEEAIKQMAKEGSISVQQFIDVMDSSFGAHAKDSNKTFEGSFDNMHAALSRTGEKFAESYRANMTDVYNSLRLFINAFNGSGASNLLPLVESFDAILRDVADRVDAITNSIKTGFIDTGALTKLLGGIADIVEGIWSIIVGIVDAFRPIGSGTEKLVQFADKFAEFAEKFRTLTQSEEFINRIVSGMEQVNGFIRTIFKTATNIIRSVLDGFGMGYSITEKTQSGLMSVLSIIGSVATTIFGLLNSQLFKTLMTFVEVGLSIAAHVLGEIIGIITRIGSAISKAFGAMDRLDRAAGLVGITSLQEAFYNIGDAIHEVLDWLKPTEGFFKGLQKLFQGIFSVAKIVANVFGLLGNVASHLFFSIFGKADKVFHGFWDVLGFILDKIGSVLVAFNTWVVKSGVFIKVEQFLCSAIDKVVEAIGRVVGWVKIAIEWVKNASSVVREWGSTALVWIKPVAKNIADWVVGAWKTVISWIQVAIDWIKKIADAFNNWLKDKTGLSFAEILAKIGETMQNVWGKMKGFFSNFPTWVKTAKDSFLGWVESIKGSSFGDFFDRVKESVKGVWESIKGLFDKTADDTSITRAVNNMSPFAKVWESIKNVFSGVFKFFKAVWPLFEAIFIGIANVVAGVFNTLSNMMNNIDWEQFNLAEVLTGGGLAAGGAGIFILFKKIKEFLDGLMNPAEGFKNTFFGQITGTLGAVKGVLTEYQKQIKADVIMTIAKAIAILAASIFVLALVDPDRITLAGTAVAGLLKILGDIITEIYSLSDAGSKDTDTGFAKMSMGFVLLSAGVLLLTFAIAKMAKIKIEDLVVGLIALHVLLWEVTNVLTKLADTDNANIEGLGITLLLLAFTIGKFVKPVKVLGSMNIMQLLQGIIALQMVMKILSDTFELLDKTSKAWSSAEAMNQAVKMVKALAFSMVLMVVPVKLLGGMDTANLGRGLLAVAALIGIMTLAMKMLMKEKETLKGDKLSSTKNGSLEGVAGALLALAASMVIMLIPLKALANIKWGEIAKLGAIIAGLLVMLGMFNAWGGDSKGALLAGVALAELAIVLKLLIGPLEDLMSIRWQDIGKAGALLAGLFVILGAFNVITTQFGNNSGSGMIATAAAMILMAVALKLFIKPLTALQAVSWKEIGQGLAIIGGTLLLLAVLGPLAGKGLKAVAVGFLILGAAVAVIGIGLLLISGALAVLTAVAAPAGVAIKIFLMAIATSIPLITQQLVNAVNIAVKGLLKAVEILLAGIILLVQAIIDPLLGLVGTLLSGILALIVKFVKDLIASLKVIIYDIRDFIYEIKDTVVDTAKVFLDTLYDLLLEINTFLENAEDVISNHIIPAIARIIVQAVNTIMAVLAYYFPSIVESVRIMLDSLIQLLIDITPRIGQWLLSLLNMVFDLLDASLPRIEQFLIRLCMVIVNVSPYLALAVMTLLDTILNMLPAIAHDAIEAIVKTLLIIFDGIGNRSQEIVDSALDMIWKILVAIVVGVYKFLDKAVDGIAEIIGDVWPKIKEWFSKKWNEIKETVKGWGKKIVDWFTGGVDDSEQDIYNASANMAQSMIDGAEDTLGIESPSKVGRQIGQYFGLGMSQGAQSYTEVLYDTGEVMTQSLADGSANGAVQNSGLSQAIGAIIPEGMLQGASGFSDLLFNTGEGLSDNLFDGMLSSANSEEKKIKLKRKGQQDGEEGYAAYTEGYEEGANKSKLKRKEKELDIVDINTVSVMVQNDTGEWVETQRPAVEEANSELGTAAARAYTESFQTEYRDNMVNGFLQFQQDEDGGYSMVAVEIAEEAGTESAEAYSRSFVDTLSETSEQTNVLSSVVSKFGLGDGTTYGTSFFDGAKESLSGFDFNSLLGGDGTNEITTRITPVISSEDESSLNLFSNGTLDVSSMWTSDGGTNVQESLMSIQENQNNDTTASEVSSLKEELLALRSALEVMLSENTSIIVNDIGPRVSSLEQAMYNMQVVMDTNAIVGQITPKIDESLGRRATYKGRGN